MHSCVPGLLFALLTPFLSAQERGVERAAAVEVGVEVDAAAARPELARPGLVRRDRIEVKLAEGSGAMLAVDGRLLSRRGVDLAPVARVFADAERVERAVSLPLETLDRWHREADERLPPGAVRPGHLGLWFRLVARDEGHGRALLDALRADRLVAYADFEPIAVACSAPARAGGGDDIPPPTPDFTSYQGYRASAPTGMGFDATRWLLGARGEAVSVYHVEVDWIWDHEDLGLTPAHFLGVPTSTTTVGANHGTGVVGILFARRNGFGMTGVVDATSLRLVSVDQNGAFVNSVAAAVAEARPGDVMTLIGGYNLQLTKPDDIVPYEFFPINFDALLTATTQGVIVIESAGNGDNDLDDARFQRRFDLSARDSGAIMVGATNGSRPQRAPFSNYGSRIDANSWGYDVGTLGYGTLFAPSGDLRQSYTERYAGTSSASAIMTGVVTSISSVARRQLGRVLTPLEVRQLLRQHGTPVTGDIGLRPDLVAIFAALGLPDGLALDRADVALGGSVSASLRGPTGASAILALAFSDADVDLGLGRFLHLDPASTVGVGSFVLADGTATWSATLPNDPGLADLDLFLQAVIVDGGSGTMRLTDSVSFWVH